MKIGPVLRKSQIILAKKSKGGTLLAKKIFFFILTSLWVSNPPSWCTDSRTVWNFAVRPPWFEIFLKNCPKCAKNNKIGNFSIFRHIFANISTQGGCTAKFHTVLESVHRDSRIDTHKDVKIKKNIFLREGSPFWFFGQNNLQLPQYWSDFQDLYLFLIRRTYVTRKQLVLINISKKLFYVSP